MTGVMGGLVLPRPSPSTGPLQALVQRMMASFALLLTRVFTRLRHLPRRTVGVAVLAISVTLASMTIITLLISSERPLLDGHLRGLLPAEHRPDASTTLVLLQPDPAHAELGDPTARLVEGGQLVAELAPEAWVPLAAPPAELEGWLAQHALALLPIERHAPLREHLSPTGLERAASTVQAAMASPLFALHRDDVRRDPLALRELAPVLDPEHHYAWLRNARATDRGDLLALRDDNGEGEALLVGLRSDAFAESGAFAVSPTALQAVVDPLGLRASIVGEARQRELETQWFAAVLEQLVLAVSAGWLAVFALARRQVTAALRDAAAILACAATSMLALAPLQPLELPVLVTALAAGTAAAQGSRSRAGLVWLALALLPLMLTPHPLWHAWVWQWPLVAGGTALVVATMGGGASRRALPARLDERRGWIIPGICITLAVGTLGWAWSEHRTAAPWEIGFAPADPLQQTLPASFFDPHAIVWHDTRERDLATALAAASEHTGELSAASNVVVDGPARLVVGETELARRRAALAEAGIVAGLRRASEVFAANGFKTDGFGEFLHAAEGSDGPIAPAAMQTALRPWIDAFTHEHDDAVLVRTALHLQQASAVDALLDLEIGSELRGPSIAAATDARRMGATLGMVCLAQLVLLALLLLLRRAHYTAVIEATAILISAHACGVTAVVLAGHPLGPHLFPALLCGGALVLSHRIAPAAKRHTSATLGLMAIVPLALLLPAAPIWNGFGVALLAALAGGWLTAVGTASRKRTST